MIDLSEVKSSVKHIEAEWRGSATVAPDSIPYNVCLVVQQSIFQLAAAQSMIDF